MQTSIKSASRYRTIFFQGLLVFLFLLVSGVQAANTVPFTFVNRSNFPDDQVFIAIIGMTSGHVWIDPSTSQVHEMSVSDNTIPGPMIGGNKGPGNNGLYANCFKRLSEIPNGIVNIPSLAGSRILISFSSQLYLYFFGYSGAPSGYAGANLANPTDPNQGVRFETIELTNNQYGIWANTTRVDSYQYPMGLEVWGAQGFYKKTGEIAGSDAIVAKWKTSVSDAFQGCLQSKEGIILAPSKIADFQVGGAQAGHFKGYVDAIWEKYKSEDLIFSSGDAGIWKGRVVGERFEFHNLTNSFGNATAYISRRPNTQEVLEEKGVLAEDVQKLSTQTLDLVVQAQFCAALNRHAIDLSAPSGTTQDWSDSSKYFKTAPYNEYVKFWHRADVSWNQSSYGFCYDDVFDYSSTIHTPTPTTATVTIGGYAQSTTSLGNRLGNGRSKCTVHLDASRTRLTGEGLLSGTISIHDAKGFVLSTSTASMGSAQLDRPLTSGTYLWNASNDHQVQTGTMSVP
jgi:Beta-1,3-glucanase